MHFGYTIIYVKNVEESLNFYQQAFACTVKYMTENKLYGELDTGKTTLSFCDESFCDQNGLSFTKNRVDTLSAGFEIAFIADDVRAAYSHAVAQGAEPVKEPSQKPWGQTVAYVRDVNGVLIEICSPIS